MGKTLLIIFVAVLGAAFAVALVVMFSTTPARQQLVGGRTLSYWLGCLDSDTDEIRASAVANLPAFGLTAVPPVIERLDARDPAVAMSAKAALAKFGAGAVPELARSLRDGSAARRQGVIELLTSMGGASAPAGLDIAALMDDPHVGNVAADYFIKLGPTSPAIEKAARVLGGIDQPRRLDAIRLLHGVVNDPRSVEALIGNARTTDPVVRRRVYLAICDIAVPPPGAIEVLVESLADPSTRPTSHTALARIGAPAIAPLAAQTTNPNDELRLAAVKALNLILSQTGGSTAPIEAFSNDPVKTVAETAQSCVRTLRTQASIARSTTQRASPPTDPGESALLEIAKKIEPPGGEDPPGGVWSTTRPTGDGPLVEQVPVNVATGFDANAFAKAVEELDDPDPQVRAKATELVRADYVRAGPVPIDFNAATDMPERLRRVRLLPFSEDWRKFDLMILALREADLGVRKAAVSAMSRSLKSPRIVERLVQALARDPSPVIRADAAMALSAAKDQIPVSRALRAAQGDPDPTVAAAAQAALK